MFSLEEKAAPICSRFAPPLPFEFLNSIGPERCGQREGSFMDPGSRDQVSEKGARTSRNRNVEIRGAPPYGYRKRRS
jgi:hypothetical protein